MKKRIYKKLYTDLAFGFPSHDDFWYFHIDAPDKFRHRRIMKLKVAEGSIEMTRHERSFTMKELENYLRRNPDDD